MSRTMRVMLIVAADFDVAKKYADLVRLSEVDELDIKCLVPPKGLTGFVEYLKRSAYSKPYVLLTADVFSNCETKPALNLVLKNLSQDKSLGLRIFVVRSHGMPNFKPETMTQAGASGVYYGSGISDKEFKAWIKRIWKRTDSSVFQEASVKRSKRNEENALVNELLSGTETGGDGGENKLPLPEDKSSSASSSTPPKEVVRPQATLPIARILGRLPSQHSTTTSQATSPPPSSWLFGGGVASALSSEDSPGGTDDEVVETGTNQFHPTAETTSEIKQIQTGEDVMQLSMMGQSSQHILLKALATACIAFGSSINEQMNVSTKPQESTGAVNENQASPAAAPKEDKGGEPPAPNQDEQHKVILETINGRRTRLLYNGWELDLPTEKADLLRLFIESKGALVTFETIGKRYKLQSKGNNHGVCQKVSNLICELRGVKPELAERFKTKRGKGYHLELPVN